MWVYTIFHTYLRLSYELSVLPALVNLCRMLAISSRTRASSCSRVVQLRMSLMYTVSPRALSFLSGCLMSIGTASTPCVGALMLSLRVVCALCCARACSPASE